MLHEAISALGGYPGMLFSENGVNTSFANRLHPCEKALMQRITNVASVYINLKNFIERHTCRTSLPGASVSSTSLPSDQQGIYLYTFCRALHEVLDPYREDVANLEKEILYDSNMTLSYVAYRADKYSILFNSLNRMILQITIENIRGCQILGFLKRQQSSGVDEVKEAVNHILYNCHIFFYKQLTGWLLYGHLMDNYKEFFIQSLTEQAINPLEPQASSEGAVYTDEENSDSRNLYPALYNFGISFKMLPPYIPATVAYKILFTGQTILMFSNNPGEGNEFTSGSSQCVSIWGAREEEFLHKLQDLQRLPRFDLNKFEVTINEIRTCVTEHLWQVAREKAELFQQLKLIKDFFLLGRGELFLEFIRILSPIFDRNSSNVTNRDVNQAFQIAARKVLFTDENALDKFYFTIQHKEQSGPGSKTESSAMVSWKYVCLCYKVSWPLHLLFTAEILDNYNKLFKFLLRVKKVQADLHSMWMTYLKSSKITDGNKLHATARQLHTGLIFLVNNLQYYLQADVLESQYTKMQAAIQNTQDFEKVQHAHAIFQSNILSQTFLKVQNTQTDGSWQMKQESSICLSKSNKRHPIHSSLSQILSLSETFCKRMQEKMEGSPILGLEAEMDRMQGEFELHFHFLMELLFSLRSEPCGEHLSQLLLRLDFNRWFSQATSFKPPQGQSAAKDS